MALRYFARPYRNSYRGRGLIFNFRSQSPLRHSRLETVQRVWNTKQLY